MGMAVSDAAFVEKRRKLVRAAPIVLGSCLALVLGFGLWLYLRQPQLINFVEVARQIDSGVLDQLTIELMAVMLPIAMLMCLVLVTGVVLLAWLGVSNERRYQKIVQDLSG
jgi:type VI protein secretion system component VasF